MHIEILSTKIYPFLNAFATPKALRSSFSIESPIKATRWPKTRLNNAEITAFQWMILYGYQQVVYHYKKKPVQRKFIKNLAEHWGSAQSILGNIRTGYFWNNEIGGIHDGFQFSLLKAFVAHRYNRYPEPQTLVLLDQIISSMKSRPSWLQGNEMFIQ